MKVLAIVYLAIFAVHLINYAYGHIKLASFIAIPMTAVAIALSLAVLI